MRNLATQVQLKLATQLESNVRDLEAASYCTLFVPKESDIVTEMHTAGRFHSDMVPNYTGKERGRPHIWFFNTVFFS